MKRDYKTAYMWYVLAGLSGYSDAIGYARELKKGDSAKVSPYEAREAQSQARRKYDKIGKRYGLD